MGWSCQHDHDGHCKRVEKACVPGMKGCTLNSSGYLFTSRPQEEKAAKKEETVDFAALVRSH
jgi:hypothetical protein